MSPAFNFLIILLILLSRISSSSSYSTSGFHLRALQNNNNLPTSLKVSPEKLSPFLQTAFWRRSLSLSAYSSFSTKDKSLGGIIDYQSQFSKIENSIEEIKNAIKMCVENIQEVENKIKGIGEKIENATKNAVGKKKNHWRVLKEALIVEKADLRAEKAALMVEKADLRAEKAALMVEKADLRRALSDKETLKTELQKKQIEMFIPRTGVIQVPDDVPFSVPIEQCTLSREGDDPSYFVGISDVVSKCVGIVKQYIVKRTSRKFRKPPLGISRMARGGKTTILEHLFEQLKKTAEINPVYINFNGNFKLKPGESHPEAILRLIAEQLVNTDDFANSGKRIVCNRYDLDNYIKESGRPFVLLIDELNSLAYPPDADAASLLREMFLDPMDRYLVFSTHRFITVDDTVSVLDAENKLPSVRKLELADLIVSFDINELRSISPSCRDLTVEEAQYYGSIPSLIFCSRDPGEPDPSFHFESRVELADFKNLDKKIFIGDLIDHILSGNYLLAPDYVKYFEIFSSVTYEKNTLSNEKKYSVSIRWPPVYIACMLNLMYQVTSTSEDYQVLGDILKLLRVDFLGHSSREGSGTGWEIITKVAILLNCVRAYSRGISLNVMNIRFGVVTSVNLDRLNGVKTLEEAKAKIAETMEPLSVGAVVLFYPSFSGFPVCDAILVYKKSSNMLQSVGIQDKLRRGYPTSNVPQWITQAVLIQGDSPGLRKESGIEGKWTYLTRDEVMELLGLSLSPMIPSNWNVSEYY